ncbi:MAG TPA: hypothetical protein VIH93_09745, partial [Thermoanaerobaculia bacterium]
MTDLIGAVLTLLTLASLAAGGYFLALRLLGERGPGDAVPPIPDPLDLAVATLLSATAEGVGLALLLGSVGLLRIAVALPLAVAFGCALVLFPRRLSAGELARPLRLLGERSRQRLLGYGALSILALHGIGNEALRGLLRPPLSWD